MLHVLEGVAQLADLIALLDGRQRGVKLSLGHLVGCLGQLFQGLCRALDGEVAHQEGDHQHEEDDDQNDDAYHGAEHVQAYCGDGGHQDPVDASDGAIEHIRLRSVQQHHPFRLVAALLTLLHLVDDLLGQAGLVGILHMDEEVAPLDATVVGMGDKGAVVGQHIAAQRSLFCKRPVVLLEDAVLIMQDLCHEVEREVGSQDGHEAALRVADGMEIGHQRRLGVLTVEERSRPEGGVSGHGILEPRGAQVVVVGTAQLPGIHLQAVVTPGVGTEPAALLGVVTVDETDAATADTGILRDDAIHDGLHLVGLSEMGLDVEDVVPDGHGHIGHRVADGPVGRHHAGMETAGTHFHNDALFEIVEHVGQAAHHDEQHQDDPFRHPRGKRAVVFLFLHCGCKGKEKK